jgi:hypothetical protein
VRQLLVNANIVPGSLILSTLTMEEIRHCETSVLTRATQHHLPEGDILHSHQHENLHAVRQLLVNANIVPGSLILSTLTMEEISHCETSVLTRATQHHLPEDDILHRHRSENLKA